MHIPVLKNEVLKILNPQPEKTYIDATVGEGGHLTAIAKEAGWRGTYLGIDIEPRNIRQAAAVIEKQRIDGKFFLENADFIKIDEIAAKHNIDKADGILFDLGFSSWHIDESGRGYGFSKCEPLDMRFDPKKAKRTAADILNTESEREIARIISEYGEEKYSRKIAREIVAARDKKLIKTTTDLAEIIARSVPRAYCYGRIHPATRTFQSLRIAVNDEIDKVSHALPKAWNILKSRGILVVISFHSLEDRIVKGFIKKIAENKEGQTLTGKPIVPSESEISDNHRSRSAKLRAAVKY